MTACSMLWYFSIGARYRPPSSLAPGHQEMDHPVGLEYRILGVTWWFTGPIRSCCDLVLAGEPVEDRSAAHGVVGEVDRWWGLGFGLGRCELSECSVWSRGSEVV